METKQLSYRQRQILYAALTEYIATGQAVSSGNLARRYGLKLSSATIRNVLAELEDLGCLVQPHPSAGRIPTDYGFRVFVDALVQIKELPRQDRYNVAAHLNNTFSQRQDFLRESGRLLASMTGTAAILTPPQLEVETLRQIRFVPLDSKQLLVVLVSRSGIVKNRIVAPQTPLSDSGA
ncbi:MAG: hypothetical protein IPJ88_04220 [Myxococcales bacterium]|nr:MAG: hypothetical protein IPJ88_04220 [Myxococcales bacterium]